MINVEIVFAQPERSIAKRLTLPPGSLIADALAAAAADRDFAGVDLSGAAVGIYGRVAARDRVLQEGDRIEIYRPLLEEPKQARRKRLSKSGRS